MTLRALRSRLQGLLGMGGAHAAEPGTLAFRCNVCGAPNALPASTIDREAGACRACGANVRFRSLVAVLTGRLFGAPAALPVSYTSKSRLLAGSALTFCNAVRPLRAAYFLGPGDAATTTIERLSPAACLIAWAKHSFLLDIEDGQVTWVPDVHASNVVASKGGCSPSGGSP